MGRLKGKRCVEFHSFTMDAELYISSHWLPVATNGKKYVNWNIELAIQPTQGNKSTCECELVDRLGHILPSMDSSCLAVHLQAPETSTNDLLPPNKAFSGPFYNVHMYIHYRTHFHETSFNLNVQDQHSISLGDGLVFRVLKLWRTICRTSNFSKLALPR